MSSMIRIRQLYPTLAQNDRKLADFLLQQPEQARHLSSQKLAEMAGMDGACANPNLNANP